MWSQVIAFLVIIALIWWLFHHIRHNPGAFSGKNLSKSFTTMGILALLLMGFIALCVLYLKYHMS